MRLKEGAVIRNDRWKWNAGKVTLVQHHKLHSNTENISSQDQLFTAAVLSSKGRYRFDNKRHQQLQKNNTWSTTNKNNGCLQTPPASEMMESFWKIISVPGICYNKKDVYVYPLEHQLARNASFILLFIGNRKTKRLVNICTVVSNFPLE